MVKIPKGQKVVPNYISLSLNSNHAPKVAKNKKKKKKIML